MRSARSTTRGFTILELLISMGIFTILGTMVIYLMTTSLDMFQNGIREAGMLDRQDAVLPVIEEDLRAMRAVADTEAPPRRPADNDPFRAAPANPPPPPPPVAVRLRSGRIKLKESGTLKDFYAPYVAFVIDISEGLDPTIAQLDTSGGPGAIDITPQTVRTSRPGTRFKATQGMMEVCYIAVPPDPNRPDLLTLYRAFRSPIGDPELTLLEPTNLNTREAIAKAVGGSIEAGVMNGGESVSTGILHFGVTWRRVFATSWEPETARRGTNGDRTRYVGPDWDSTRGADSEWAMFAGRESLADPSDDVFPAFVRLEVVTATPTKFGYVTGDLRLLDGVNKDDIKITVDDVDILFAPDSRRGRDRFLKIGREWLGYRTDDVDYTARVVTVERGLRGTQKQVHELEAGIHVGSFTQTEIRLPVYRDRFTLPEER